MLYQLVRPLARAAITIYFRKIYISNSDRIPVGKPVLLACNHPTGFMEPCILACFLDRPLYFLVRGDFFSKRHFERMLRALNMLPVFRMKDGGYRKLKENYATFEACHRALRDNCSIMVFSEGSTEYIKKLRPLQKGIARIAFGALEHFSDLEDVYIVPVGVTYTDVNRFRSRVMIDFGHALKARDHLEAHDLNPSEGLQGLLESIRTEMEGCLVHVEDRQKEHLVDQMIKLQKSKPPFPVSPVLSTDSGPLHSAQSLAAAVEKLEDDPRKALEAEVEDLEGELDKAGFAPGETWPVESPNPFTKTLLALAWLPCQVGRVLHFFPLTLIRQTVDKQVKSMEFKAPIMIAGGMGYYFAWLLILGIVLALTLGWPWVLLILVSPILVWLQHWRYDRALLVRNARKLKKLPTGKLEEWERRREAILKVGS